MTFKLGLTGSIGMGKSTTAKMFEQEGCELWDADAAVHRIYGPGGDAVEPLKARFPSVIVGGKVSREALKEVISRDPSALGKVEKIVHPLVVVDRENFLSSVTADIAVFDIPLLFETGGNKQMNAVACVSTSEEEQQKRVLSRGTMTRDQFQQILSNQMPNKVKCARSDFVIVTDTLEHARTQVHSIVRQIRKGLADA